MTTEKLKKIGIIIIVITILNILYNYIFLCAYIKGQEDIFNQLRGNTTKQDTNKIAYTIIYKRDSLRKISFFGYQIK